MLASGDPSLLRDIAFSFGLPLLVVAIGLLNIKMTPVREAYALKQTLVLAFGVILFACILGPLLFQDRAVIAGLWRAHPLVLVTVSTMTLAVVVSVIGAVVWRRLR